MSKKHKKFKKKFKAELLAELSKSQTQSVNAAVIQEPAKAEKTIHSLSDEKFFVEAASAKKDLKTIALIFGFFIIVLVVLYFINIKTSYLTDFSNILAKALRYQ